MNFQAFIIKCFFAVPHISPNFFRRYAISDFFYQQRRDEKINASEFYSLTPASQIVIFIFDAQITVVINFSVNLCFLYYRF